MNKFKISVQCPECQGCGYIKIEKSRDDLSSYYTSFQQCTECRGFGTILIDRKEDENDT